MAFVLSIVVIAAVLGLSEVGWRQHWFNNEFGRKFVHITVGSFVAFWPFFLTWNQIRILSVLFLIAVVCSNYFKVFHAIHSVQRPTFGEICFALTVGLLTYVTQSKGVYAAALLQMSVADGAAAIIGTRFGQNSKYHFLGHTKSIAGTFAFFVCSILLLTGYAIFSSHGATISIIIFGSVAATIIENIAILGFDNLLVPLFIGVLLAKL